MYYKDLYLKAIDDFNDNPASGMQLIKDTEIIESFEKETGKDIGIIDNSPYYDFRMDLFQNSSGKLFRYCHVQYPENKRGAVTLVIFKMKHGDYILIQNHYRIFVDSFCQEIPRGFADPNDTDSLYTALRELHEETSIDISTLKKNIIPLGNINTDSGLTNNTVDLYAVEIWTDILPNLANNDKNEAVSGYNLIPSKDISNLISSNMITDSFTLCALCKYWSVKSFQI